MLGLLLLAAVSSGLAFNRESDSRAVACVVPSTLDLERELAQVAVMQVNASLNAADVALLDALAQTPCSEHSMKDSILHVCHSRNAELWQNGNVSMRLGNFDRAQWSKVVGSGLGWQWLTLQSGTVVRAVVHHYTQGEICRGSGRPKTLHTFTYCGGDYQNQEDAAHSTGCQPELTWAGVDDGLRAYSMASWMRYSNCYDCPDPADACGLRAHIALPASCSACSHQAFHTLRKTVQRYQQVLALAPKDTTTKHHDDVDVHDVQAAQAQGGKQTLTYGEISLEGSLRLGDLLGLTSEPRSEPTGMSRGSQYNIYDLGSGKGAFCILLAMLCRDRCGEVVGIELMSQRHDKAVATKAAALEAGLLNEEEGSKLDVRLGDALNETAFLNATHLYVASTCFTESMFRQLLRALANAVESADPPVKNDSIAAESEDSRTASRVSTAASSTAAMSQVHLQCLISLRPIPAKELHRHNHRHRRRNASLELVAKVPVPTTWSLRAKAYVYAVGGKERYTLSSRTVQDP